MHEDVLYPTAIGSALLCRHQRQAEVLRCLEAVCGAAEVQAEPWAHVRRKRRLGALSLPTFKPADSCQVHSVVLEETIIPDAGAQTCPAAPQLMYVATAFFRWGGVERRQAPAAQKVLSGQGVHALWAATTAVPPSRVKATTVLSVVQAPACSW